MSETPRALDRRRTLGAAALVAVVALGLGGAAARHPRLTHDSLLYGLVGEQLRAGRGLRSPVAPLALARRRPPDAQGTVPFTVQPPLYPALLAAVGGAGPGGAAGAAVLGLLAHLATALASLWIVARGVGWAGGLAAGLAVAAALPLLEGTGVVLSEPVFTAAALASLAALLGARDAARPGRWWLASGLAAAAALATRYAGVFLLPVLLYEGARAVHAAEDRRRAALRALVGLAPPLAVGAGLAGRNLALSGHLRGFGQTEGVRSLADAASGVAQLLADQALALPPPWALTLLVVVFVGGAAASLLRPRPAPTTATALDLALAACASYAATLAWALTAEPQLEPRYAAPAVPLLLASGVLAAGAVGRRAGASARPGAAAVVAAFVCLVWLGPGVLRTATGFRPATAPQTWPWRQTPAHRWLQTCPPDTLVVTNRPVETAALSGRAALALPTRWWNPSENLPDDPSWLPEAMQAARAPVLFLAGGPRGLPAETWGPFVAELSRGRDPTGRLELVWRQGHALAYRLRDP